ncbi:hypothetical protein IWX49DRAFT_332259 [Phyllosticta citricarpa]
MKTTVAVVTAGLKARCRRCKAEFLSFASFVCGPQFHCLPCQAEQARAGMGQPWPPFYAALRSCKRNGRFDCRHGATILSTLFLEGSRYRRKSSMADPTFEAAESYERASPNHTASLGPPPSCNQHQSFGQAALALRHHLAPPCPSLACLFGYRAWMSNEPLSNQHLVMALHSHLRASWSQPERKTAVDRPAARHRIMVNHGQRHSLTRTPLTIVLQCLAPCCMVPGCSLSTRRTNNITTRPFAPTIILFQPTVHAAIFLRVCLCADHHDSQNPTTRPHPPLARHIYPCPYV